MQRHKKHVRLDDTLLRRSLARLLLFARRRRPIVHRAHLETLDVASSLPSARVILDKRDNVQCDADNKRQEYIAKEGGKGEKRFAKWR